MIFLANPLRFASPSVADARGPPLQRFVTYCALVSVLVNVRAESSNSGVCSGAENDDEEVAGSRGKRGECGW